MDWLCLILYLNTRWLVSMLDYLFTLVWCGDDQTLSVLLHDLLNACLLSTHELLLRFRWFYSHLFDSFIGFYFGLSSLSLWCLLRQLLISLSSQRNNRLSHQLQLLAIIHIFIVWALYQILFVIHCLIRTQIQQTGLLIGNYGSYFRLPFYVLIAFFKFLRL